MTAGIARPRKPIRYDWANGHNVRQFVDMEDEYHAWLQAHHNGFVINTFREPSPAYMVIHRAACPHISKSRFIHTAFTTHEYIKLCFESKEDLKSWASAHDASPSSCGACKPDSAASTNSNQK